MTWRLAPPPSSDPPPPPRWGARHGHRHDHSGPRAGRVQMAHAELFLSWGGATARSAAYQRLGLEDDRSSEQRREQPIW